MPPKISTVGLCGYDQDLLGPCDQGPLKEPPLVFLNGLQDKTKVGGRWEWDICEERVFRYMCDFCLFCASVY